MADLAEWEEAMHWLVTAGATAVPIDQVREISNRASGRTGAQIAREAHRRGERVTLLTSQPLLARDIAGGSLSVSDRWEIVPYHTFDDLQRFLQENLTSGRIDVLVHSAAVSDYRTEGIYAPAAGTQFDRASLTWHGGAMTDSAAGKVRSDEPELWLRLVRTPKLVDLVRQPWGFRGVLVKFKLEVGLMDSELLEVAERSRQQSAADLMVANTLEGARSVAWLGPGEEGNYQRLTRSELPTRLFEEVQRVKRRRGDG